MKKLTVKEALEQGYTKCAFANTDPIILMSIEKLHPDDWKKADQYRGILLAEKESYPFTISAEKIKELVSDYLVNQDEVYDEDAELAELADEADYETIAADINQRMSKKRWWNMTDILLAP